jgi:hypothetical protein
VNIPAPGGDWRQWAEEVRRVLARSWSILPWRVGDDRPGQNGRLIWDEAQGAPVVSKSGAFETVLIGGNAVSLTGIPTYADNAEAVADGQAVGAVYKTASGELRVVV